MNKLILAALLPLAAFASLAHAAAVPAIRSAMPTIVSPDLNPVDQNILWTESNWERVILPQDALSKLGNLNAVQLTTAHLPRNVTVSISAANSPRNTIGLWVRRSNTRRGVHQSVSFTLTNPDTKASYTFDAMVVGAGN